MRKYRKKFLKFFLNHVQELEDLNDFGQDSEDQNLGGQGSDESTDKKSADEKSNHIDDFTDFWDTEADEADEDTKTIQQVVVQQADSVKTDQLDNHINGLGFDEMVGQIDLDDRETRGEALSGAFKQVYKNALISANQLMSQKLDALETKLSEMTQQQISGSEVKNMMHAALPFTKKKTYKPMAEVVLQRALDRGEDPATAVSTVTKYFKSLATNVAKDLPKSQKAPVNRRLTPLSQKETRDKNYWTDMFKSV